MQLSERELATVLADLRHWQRDLADHPDRNEGPMIPDHFEGFIPLTVDEIDDLCERLDLDD